MKKIYISTIAAAILATGAMAESNSIKEAFTNGKTSGDISVYTEAVNNSGATKDSGVTIGSFGLAYETDSISGFKGAVGFRANHKLTEKEDGDFDETTPKSVFHTANVSYSTDGATIIVGRQAIDLEWIGDYHEAVVGVITAVPDTTIVVAHTTRKMEADADSNLNKMTHIRDSTGVDSNNGASVLDVKYEGIANTVINPYFMNANDVFSAYGLKATTTIANIDLTGHYAVTDEDTQKDGSIGHIEIGTAIGSVALSAGYVTTNKDVGAGSLAHLGDNIDPSEDLGNSIYGADADTFYGSISADVSSISLGAVYTSVKHGNDKDSEILLTAGTSISDELSLELLVSSLSMEDSSSDTDKITLMATYSF